MSEQRLNILLPLGLITIIGIGSAGSIIYFSDPFTDGLIAHTSLYASIFLSSAAFFAILSELIKILIPKLQSGTTPKTSIRQGVLIGILLTASLALQSQNLLFWWVEITLILFLLAVEFFLNL